MKVDLFFNSSFGKGCQDKLAKQRLQARRFCYMRHPRYKSIIEPDAHPKNSLFLNPKRKEFWRTDMEAVLHKEADQRKSRQKVSEATSSLPMINLQSLQQRLPNSHVHDNHATFRTNPSSQEPNLK
jgi:hypothetical protein